ncbi:electron transport complex subunit RsxB [Ferrimonas balearica]|uniref:electron transport complex subunit RsxB n=1 Tax=Ferrimonas balearica TaxID=44012 RepID=UPI001C9916D8|nr:electron transport complex subunit RsxB [Ferrimonas balearica]MBY5920085.1 electron transport complex subunit RsxB [Ferrimonas balearica]MBY5997230.1 electron transport complex subunit RsxB [Ferrimonas balearica]
MSSILFAVLVLAGLALVFGVLLGYAAIRFKVEGDPMVEQIEQALPQTQCGQCGFPGCRPYAEAIAKGEAPINRCPPGGEATVQKLADMLGVDPEPLDADADSRPKVAYIREAECIGCTKCIQACPVDAIVGTGKQMHTVIADLCTGCDLCVEPCPVDCIDMLPIAVTPQNWKWDLESIPVRMVQ